MANTSKADCFLCGKAFSKNTFKNHAMNAHRDEIIDGQDCIVLKVEGAQDNDYCLYLDVSANSTLKVLDQFLREIWLECCGHMSGFYIPPYEEIGMSQKIKNFPDSTVLKYEYDFGSTTELKITIVGRAFRQKQHKAVRLLGRNQPFLFDCAACGQSADFICLECLWNNENPFYCESCSEQHDHEETLLPVVNSPRMGECAYCGELDVYEFNRKMFDIGKSVNSKKSQNQID